MKSDEFIGTLFVIGLIVGGIVWIGDRFFNGYLPGVSYSYPEVCIATGADDKRNQIPLDENKCHGQLYAYIPGRIGYKAIPAAQVVTAWNVDPKSAPFTLGHCVVVDRENWRCEDSDAGTTKQMVDGDYQEIGYINQDNVYISKWHWWFMRITGDGLNDYDIAHLNDPQ